MWWVTRAGDQFVGHWTWGGETIRSVPQRNYWEARLWAKRCLRLLRGSEA
jgi:hypothetical protein